MKDLNYELKQMCDRNRGDSNATQADRQRILSHAANQLIELGFRDKCMPHHAFTRFAAHTSSLKQLIHVPACPPKQSVRHFIHSVKKFIFDRE